MRQPAGRASADAPRRPAQHDYLPHAWVPGDTDTAQTCPARVPVVTNTTGIHMKKRITVTVSLWAAMLIATAHPALAGIQNMG